MRQSTGLFLVFVLAAMLSGTILELSGILNRAELQTIDRMFEARHFLNWKPEALKRLDPAKILDYHEKHEIPRRWWAWDYTLSWLLEENHVPVVNKFVIFNHLLEDEPPLEAQKDFPWMKPLMQFPISRADVAGAIEFLAKSGVKVVILDNDFPQYSSDDAVLASTIHRCASGELAGRKVPIFMASTVNRRSFMNILQLDAVSKPSGVLNELAKLEPGVDVAEKYTGTTSMFLDEDQVVRRTVCTAKNFQAQERSSIAIKVLKSLAKELPDNLPREMDIDFAGPPNSSLYPVRPFHYLLDPELKARLQGKSGGAADGKEEDVTLDGAIVILGDGVTDVYATPYTNLGVNLMSGPEILAQSIDTISRRSWHTRLSRPYSYFYLALCAVLGAALLRVWKHIFGRVARRATLLGLVLDVAFCAVSIAVSYLVACLLFCYGLLIVPVVVPAIALMVASLTTALWERENERAQVLKQKLEHAEERLNLQIEKHDEELKRQAAEAHVQEIMQDEQRRQEFIRRINHDLKAPVTVMSWILAKLKQGGLGADAVAEKIEKLAKTSNRLVDLLHELASSYEKSSRESEEQPALESCQLNKILSDCVAMARPLAEMKEDQIELSLSDRVLWVNGVSLNLSRIFDNLVRNAIIHNPSGTSIHIEARSSAHVHQIIISDTGRGIEAEKLPLLFTSTKEKCSSGEGLGLQIVASFVESMGGKISVKSEFGHGTTFTITLPSSHLEAGGDSGEDILSTGQHRVIELLSATSVVSSTSSLVSTSSTTVDESRGSDHE